MPSEESSAYCPECRRNVMIRRQTPNHLIHALVTLFLRGLWLPVWLVIALLGNSTWRCTRCGSTDLRD